jgi:hypothetical protein
MGKIGFEKPFGFCKQKFPEPSLVEGQKPDAPRRPDGVSHFGILSGVFPFALFQQKVPGTVWS